MEILDRCGLRECNLNQASMEPQLKLSKESTEVVVD
jgi:hypothetical protein